MNDASPALERGDRAARRLDPLLALAEQAIYVVVAALLVLSAGVAVTVIAHDLLVDLQDGALGAVKAALDGLLLVFILVELLGAVRATIVERQLVAEPFLVVGIIAAIKEILVASLEAGAKRGSALEDAMLEIVGLALVVLLLSVAGFLVRRKEREPSEQTA